MKIDFKNEVLKRKEEILDDLAKLIEINSELTTYDPKRKGMPFYGRFSALAFHWLFFWPAT